jgi:hypothetical protein
MRIEVRQIMGAHRSDGEQTQGELSATFSEFVELAFMGVAYRPDWRHEPGRPGCDFSFWC